MMASFLIGGSVTWLYYTDRLLEFPLGMFGVAIGTVILPHLSGRHAATDPQGFSQRPGLGFPAVLLIGVPACLGLVLLRRAADRDAVPVRPVQRLRHRAWRS